MFIYSLYSSISRQSKFDHRQIIFSIEGMFVIVHHRNQHGFGDILLVVRLPPVQVEIIHAGTLERTDFTVEGLYLVVNITDVFLQVGRLVECFLTLGTALSFLSWL